MTLTTIALAPTEPTPQSVALPPCELKLAPELIATPRNARLLLAAIGTLFLVVGLVYLLNYLAPSLPLFACWLIVGGVLVAGGLAAAYVGKTIFEKHNPLPDKTFNALTENLTWQTTPSPK